MSSTKLSIGIVGLPNSGKSTLFQALTKKQVLIASYPFATIDPNKGIVPVPDERIAKLAHISHSEKITPTTIEFVDIAGLVRGAAQGEGLGNEFLAHIREVDAIAHTVRSFSDANVPHVHGAINPQEDIAVIETELMLADQATVGKRREDLMRKLKMGAGRDAQTYADLIDKVWRALGEGKPARALELSEEEQTLLKDLHLLTQKPVLFVFNTDKENPAAEEYAAIGLPCAADGRMALNAKLEVELAELSEEEAQEYRRASGRTRTGLEELIVKGYALLDLITFFTTGEKETRAWTVKRGTKAPQAAGVIHTDFERGFIRAEVGNWKSFAELGGEQGMRQRGLWRVEGKEYVIQDGDVCYFRFSV